MAYQPFENAMYDSTLVADSMGWGETAMAGALATVTDAGLSIWNSLTPMDWNLSTRDALASMSDSALAVYDSDKETIETLSLIGGSIAPAGLALKGLQMMRKGMQAKGFFSTAFSEAGKAKRMSELEHAYANSPLHGSKELSSLVRQNYAINIGNNVFDAAIAEAAIVGAMNSHTMMEDYLENPVQNIGISLMIGGGLGAVGGIISTNVMKRTAKANVEKDLVKPMDLPEPAPFLTAANTIMKYQQNLDHLDQFAPNSTLMKESLDSLVRSQTAKLYDTARTRLLKGIDDEELLETMVQKVARDPRFAGAESISYATEKSKDAVLYHPRYDTFIGDEATASQLLGAANLGYNKLSSIKPEKVFARKPRDTYFVDAATSTTAERQLDQLKAFRSIQSLKDTELNAKRLHVDEDDLPTMQALSMRMWASKEPLAATVTVYSKGVGKELTLKDMDQLSFSKRVAGVEEDIKAGLPLEVVAERHMIKLPSLHKYIATKNPQFDFMITNLDEVDDFLSPKNRALALKTDNNRMQEAHVKSAVNAATTDKVYDEIFDFNVRSSPSALSDFIAKNILDDLEIKEIATRLRMEAPNIRPAKVGGNFFTSGNFAVRDLGTAGDAIVASGKKATTLKAKASEQLLAPLALRVKDLVKSSEAESMELLHALNVYSGGEGKLAYAGRSFYKIEKEKIDLPDGTKLQVTPSFLTAADDVMLDSLRTAGAITPLLARESQVAFKVASDKVDAVLKEMAKLGRDLYHHGNAMKKTNGMGQLQDRGFWTVPANLRGKEIAYVVNPQNADDVTIITGRNASDLSNKIDAHRLSIKGENTYQYITKGEDQVNWSKISGRIDPITVKYADSSKLHGGSSQSTFVSTSTQTLTEIMEGYEFLVNKHVEDAISAKLRDTLGYFKNLTRYESKGNEGVAKTVFEKFVSKASPARGTIMANMALGRSNLDEYALWKNTDSAVTATTDFLLGKIAPVIEGLTKRIATGKNTEEQAKAVMLEMEKLGIQFPFKSFDDFSRNYAIGRERVPNRPTAKALALANGVTVSVMLRALEFAQVATNLLAVPVLSSGAFSRVLNDPAVKIKAYEYPKMLTNGMRLMMGKEGMNVGSANAGKWHAKAVAENLFDEDWRTYNNIVVDINDVEGRWYGKVEKFLAGKEGMSKLLFGAADWSDKVTRQQAYYTGIALAKRAYPQISDEGAFIFARNFMNEAVGNYTGAQRPAMFQGNVGSAMGLFQTYMLTLAQNTYRNIERGQFKVLAQTMLLQGGIFGASSLPGFEHVSRTIGENFSDDHVDLQTGAVRALGNETAEYFLYGFPSQIAGLTTRGAVNPKVPNPLSTDQFVLYNAGKQAIELGERLVKAVTDENQDAGRAMLEALSLQALHRPTARVAELVLGKSITKQGNIVTSEEDPEFYTGLNVLSRVMGARPIEEVMAREVMYLDSVYDAKDRERKRAVTYALKSAIESGDLDMDQYESLMSKYLEVGTVSGWRSAIRDAQVQASREGYANVAARLDEDSPLHSMLNDL